MTKKSPLPLLAPLTPKEKSVLEFIENHILSSGISPSYQEIKEHFGLASFNSVQNYLKQLTAKGYIENPSGQKRAIQILHSATAVQKNLHSKLVSTATGSPRSQLLQAREEILSLPLLGKVAAGQPIEAFKHEEFVDVPPSLVRNPSQSFALKVQGDSMIEDGIFDEDIILVQKQNSANNGDIIVATVDNEATVKRLYLRAHPEHSHSGKMVELRPSNSTMKSLWYSPEQVEIRGLVVGLIRKF
ncbi:MAG: transcriptional repressor LexA [Bdellovibrio sp.]